MSSNNQRPSAIQAKYNPRNPLNPRKSAINNPRNPLNPRKSAIYNPRSGSGKAGSGPTTTVKSTINKIIRKKIPPFSNMIVNHLELVPHFL